MWTLRRSLGEVLGDVRRMLDEVCPLRAPAPPPGPSTTESGAGGGRVEAQPPSPGDPEADDAAWSADPAVPIDPDAPVPPGPWRWRWVWPGPGRPAGMALIAADGALVLWSPGGFASHLVPPDGRPTPEVAAALASLPTLSDEAASAAELRAELEKARATAREARLLLHRAADAVDDAIDRRQGGSPA